MKFLHMADVHLGCTRYQLPESPRDFFDAWIDVLRRYAIAENVDFVIISGDLFHKRVVPPETMDYAVAGLTEMRRAGIPVVAIEGNHDQKHTDSEFSWLRSLSKWGLLKLLEPTMLRTPNQTADQLIYDAWDDTQRKGGFIDISRARIFGADWYGASANKAIPMLTKAIKENRRPGAFHILMLHTDVEGHEVHPIPALSLESLNKLKAVVDYVAIGHTHKHYAIDNWAFNPGSIEITNISDFREDRGAFVVTVDDQNVVSSVHASDYHHRPFQQLSFEVTALPDPTSVTNGVLKLVTDKAIKTQPGKPAPIIEITLRGQLGFPNSTLELAKIRDAAKQITSALHIRIKNNTVPVEYVDTVEKTEDNARDQLERRVIQDLVRRDDRYNVRTADVAEAIVGAKRMVLNDEPVEKVVELIALKVRSGRWEQG